LQSLKKSSSVRITLNKSRRLVQMETNIISRFPFVIINASLVVFSFVCGWNNYRAGRFFKIKKLKIFPCDAGDCFE